MKVWVVTAYKKNGHYGEHEPIAAFSTEPVAEAFLMKFFKATEMYELELDSEPEELDP